MEPDTLAKLRETRNAVAFMLAVAEETRRDTVTGTEARRRAERRAVLRAAADRAAILREKVETLPETSETKRAAVALYLAEAYARGGVNRRCSTALLRALLDLGDRLGDAVEALDQQLAQVKP